MKLGFLNINTVSLAHGLIFEKFFEEILFFSENKNDVHLLNTKFFKTNQTDLQHKLLYSQKITATTDPVEVINKSDILLCYEDCKVSSDNLIDISPVLEQIQKFYLSSHVDVNLYGKKFVVLSTLNFGDSKIIEEKINQFGIEYCYCPLFINEDSVLESLEKTELLLLGSIHNSLADQIFKLYSDIKKVRIKTFILPPSSVEIAKLSITALQASKMVIKNTVGDLLISSGLKNEINSIFDVLNTQIVENDNVTKFGLNYGGPNISKEINSLSEFSKTKKVEKNIFEFIDLVNEEHFQFIKHYYLELNKDKSIPFIIESLGYKKYSDNLENSQRLKLCLELLNEGYEVNVIETSSQIIEKLSSLSESYENRLKFFSKDSKVNGFRIEL